jgi:hypothetical protein
MMLLWLVFAVVMVGGLVFVIPKLKQRVARLEAEEQARSSETPDGDGE